MCEPTVGIVPTSCSVMPFTFTYSNVSLGLVRTTLLESEIYLFIY